jgi:hypothetical protein
VAESHRGVVAHVPKTGFGRGGLRRQLRDRSGDEGRYTAAKPESEGMGVGSSSQTAEAPEAHFCVPYLRNGALQRYSQVLNLDLVATVIEPSSDVSRSDLGERLLHCLQQSFVGARTKLS